MDARHAIMHYKHKGDRVDEVLRSIVLNHVSRLESENKRLREALEFYADEENYEVTLEWREGEMCAGPTYVEYDEGKIARKALEVD